MIATSVTNSIGKNWVSPGIIETLLRATQNCGYASKMSLMESANLPFSLFDDYLQYLLFNGFVQARETPDTGYLRADGVHLNVS
jgi:hypothetical protein